MRIALISPPTNEYEMFNRLEPLGLCYLAAVCRQASHEVRLFDLPQVDSFDVPGFFETLDAFRPEVVGVSSMTENFRNGLELMQAAKSRYGCTTIYGGWHVSGAPELVTNPAIDFIVCGEGEDTLLELLEHIATGAPERSAIEGIAYESSGKAVVNPSRGRIKKLDRLPLPDRSDLEMARYRFPQFLDVPMSRMRVASVQASRGCPYKCVFCQTPTVWSNIWTRRSPVDVVDEIEMLVEKHGTNALFIRDEEFTLQRNWVIEICNEMERRGLPDRLVWGHYCRVDDVTPELVDALKRGGVGWVFMGLEVSNPEDGERLQKYYKREHAENACRLLRKCGILTQGNWVIGFPWDTAESLERAFEWLRTLPLDFFTVSCATPFVGTELYKQVVTEGRLLTDDPNHFCLEEVTIQPEHMDIATVHALKRSYPHRYYLQPRQILHTTWMLLRHPRRIRSLIEILLKRYERHRWYKSLPEGERRRQRLGIPTWVYSPLDESETVTLQTTTQSAAT